MGSCLAIYRYCSEENTNAFGTLNEYHYKNNNFILSEEARE